ncbi:MAG: hypothetical protein V3R51_04735 [Gammaproteobacteria bacterium]
MKCSRPQFLAVLLCLCNIPQLYADATITLRSTGESDATFYARNGMVRINIADQEGGYEGYMVFDSRTKQLTMVDTKNRRKMDMSEGAMDRQMNAMKGYQSQMATMMEQQMKNMPESQRQMIREQMKMSPMAPPVSPPAKKALKPRIVKVGKGKSGKYDCIEYEAFQGNTKTAEACFASAKELQLSKTDYNAFKAMFAYMKTMQEKASAMAGPYGGGDDDAGFTGDEAEGLPVFMKNLRSGEESVVTGVSDNKLSDDLFKIPDYPDLEMPTPPGMQR